MIFFSRNKGQLRAAVTRPCIRIPWVLAPFPLHMMVDLHMRFHVFFHIRFNNISEGTNVFFYFFQFVYYFFTFFSLHIIAEKAHFKCVEFSVVLSLDHLSGANLVCHVRRLSNEQLIMG